jgi:amino acid adenylation domain-containing protein
MDEGVVVSASELGDLKESAPLRDFLRPATATCEPAVCSLDPSASVSAQPAFLIACVATILARHSGRDRVCLVLHRVGRLQLLRADASPGRSFSQLAHELSAQLPASPRLADLGYVPGVLVDLADGRESPVPEADLIFRFEAVAQGLSAAVTVNTLLYRHEWLRPLARQLRHVMGTATADAEVAVRRLSLHDEAERQRIVYAFNALRSDFGAGQTLHGLIEAQAADAPHAVCAVHGDRQLTFADLNSAANRLARLLVALGAGPGRFVAIVDHRGLDFLTAMLATWKAGGAYIPVDPGYPEDRIRYMLADSAAPVAVVGPAALQRLGSAIVAGPELRHVVCLQPPLTGPAVPMNCTVHGPAAFAEQAATDLGHTARASDPAYMIYTSGTTGRPKGAVVRHDGAVNHILAQAHCLGANGVSRFLQSAPSSSDISVWQFAGPLVLGGATVIVDDPTDVANIFAQVRRHGLQIIELVPVLLKYLLEYARCIGPAERALPSLRWAMVTGESATVDLVNTWLELFPNVPVVNAYGPTEAADDVAQAILKETLPVRQLTVPIGRPLANLDVYVVDECLEPVPVGVPGEIGIAGVGVGDGYWRQDERTRQSFVPNPFPGAAGPVLYLTGDMGRLRDDGTLECLGRRDQQVKLRGFRIELQEIESVLRGHPGVRDAAVQVFHDSHGGGQIVAYVVAGAGSTPSDPDLRAFMAKQLAGHMVPSSVVFLARLPLSPAGKVDRKALLPPTPAVAQARGPTGSDTGTAVEATLVHLWQQELGVERIGLHDDFFSLGGDSLAALAIAVAARAAGLHLRSADVLQCPTVALLAQVARAVPERAKDGAWPHERTPPIRPLPESERNAFLRREARYEEVHPLTPPQQGIYVQWLLARDKTVYVDQYVYRLRGALVAQAYAQSWQFVARRHAGLRSTFVRSALSQPAQGVLRSAEFEYQSLDWSAHAVGTLEPALREWMRADLERGFALGQQTPMRITLIRVSPTDHRMVWTHHHVLLDGWSLSLVMREVLAAYEALVAGRPPHLPEPVPYTRYAQWLVEQDMSAGVAFWHRTLSDYRGPVALDLAAPRARVAAFAHTEFELSAGDTEALTHHARQARVTLGTVLCAAWACVLSRHGLGNDVVLGLVTSGREIDLPDVDAIVGLFVTTLPTRIRTGRAGPVDEWLSDVQRQAAQSRQHEAVPLAHITRACGLAPGQGLFETIFVMANYPGVESGAAGSLQVEPTEFRTVPAYPLSVIVTPGSRLSVRLVYDGRQFASEAIVGVSEEFRALLHGMLAGDDPRVAA